MPKPLSAGKRNAIIEDIKAARESGKSAGQIARDHGVARSTVTKITREEGLTGAFERAQTENATRAREVDCKALRAQLKVDLMQDAQWLRQRARGRYQTVVSTPQGAEIVTLDEAPLSEVRSGYTALGIAVDKSLALERHDNDASGGLAAVDEWLRGMMGEGR
jgi:transposase-like protein